MTKADQIYQYSNPLFYIKLESNQRISSNRSSVYTGQNISIQIAIQTFLLRVRQESYGSNNQAVLMGNWSSEIAGQSSNCNIQC